MTVRKLTPAMLRCLRETYGFSPEVFSALAGIDKTTLIDMEHGLTPIPEQIEEKMQKIGDYFDELIDQGVIKARAMGYVMAPRHSGDIHIHMDPSLVPWGTVFCRRVATFIHMETNLPIRYPTNAVPAPSL